MLEPIARRYTGKDPVTAEAAEAKEKRRHDGGQAIGCGPTDLFEGQSCEHEVCGICYCDPYLSTCFSGCELIEPPRASHILVEFNLVVSRGCSQSIFPGKFRLITWAEFAAPSHRWAKRQPGSGCCGYSCIRLAACVDLLSARDAL